MKIYFERSGGFAGMLSSTTVDTQNLSSKEANEIKNLVEKNTSLNFLQSCHSLLLKQQKAQLIILYIKSQFKIIIIIIIKANTLWNAMMSIFNPLSDRLLIF
jgi:hypothetical protein